MIITSTNNSKIKRLRSLYKNKKMRLEEGVFVCEGINLIKDIPLCVKVCELFIKQSEYDKLKFLEEKFSIESNVIPDSIFDSIADTVNPSGVIAIVDKIENRPITGEKILLLCGITDSGNLGTIFRTASACGIDDILCVDCADTYSPKVVRASMGGVFYENIIECSLDTVKSLIPTYEIVVLDMQGVSIYEYKRENKIALALGSEAHGVPSEIKEISNKIISLPMKSGRVESLNAAVSVGIAMYIIK
jgi:TrmH family RNA methyltransferase